VPLNCLLDSATLAHGASWVLVHLRAVGQVDSGRTITGQVSKPGAALLSVPLTFCLNDLRTTVETQLQRHLSQDVGRSTRTICTYYITKGGSAE